jgi:hypothetical protein
MCICVFQTKFASVSLKKFHFSHSSLRLETILTVRRLSKQSPMSAPLPPPPISIKCTYFALHGRRMVLIFFALLAIWD